MPEIIHILILLVIMNYYLQFRMRGALQAGQKFIISLMSIFLLFLLLFIIGSLFPAYFDQHKQNKLMSPLFVNIVFLFMNFIMPIITTEIILAGYKRFVLSK